MFFLFDFYFVKFSWFFCYLTNFEEKDKSSSFLYIFTCFNIRDATNIQLVFGQKAEYSVWPNSSAQCWQSFGHYGKIHGKKHSFYCPV